MQSISVDTVRTVTEENHDAGKVIRLEKTRQKVFLSYFLVQEWGWVGLVEVVNGVFSVQTGCWGTWR